MKTFIVLLFIKFALFIVLIVYEKKLSVDFSVQGVENLVLYFKAPSIILSAELVLVNLVLSLNRLHLLNKNSKLSEDSLDINRFKLLYDYFDDSTSKIKLQYGNDTIKSKSELWRQLLNPINKVDEYDLSTLSFHDRVNSFTIDAQATIKSHINNFLEFRDNFTNITSVFQNLPNNS